MRASNSDFLKRLMNDTFGIYKVLSFWPVRASRSCALGDIRITNDSCQTEWRPSHKRARAAADGRSSTIGIRPKAEAHDRPLSEKRGLTPIRIRTRDTWSMDRSSLHHRR